MVKSDKEHHISHCQSLLEEIGLPQLRERVNKFNKESFPLLKQKQNYYNLKLKVEGSGEIIASESILKCFEEKQEDGIDRSSPLLKQVENLCNINMKVEGTGELIASEGILECLEEKQEDGPGNVPMKNIIFLQGESGSGKTTLLRAIQEDILRKEEEKQFEGSKAFEIPSLIACRNSSYRTMTEFLGKELSKIAERVNGNDLIETAVGKMNSLLLVDGLDEINDDSKVLIEDVIMFLKNHTNAKCIFTSRPHAVKKFQNQLDKEGLPYQTLKIEQIRTKEEQLKFLKIACQNGRKIAEAYEKVNLELQSPVLLAIYSHFYSKDPESVKGWILPSHVMRGAIDFGHQTAVQRLHRKNVQNSIHVGDLVLEWFSFVSFCCLLKRKQTLGREEINWLIEKTEDKV